MLLMKEKEYRKVSKKHVLLLDKFIKDEKEKEAKKNQDKDKGNGEISSQG